jgi:serine/threonine protein phosphatase PrpC
MRHFTYTEAAHGHTNEDCGVVQPHPSNERVLLCALADGQGGRSGGREASQIAVNSALAYLAKQSPNDLVDVREWFIGAEKADDEVSRDAEAGFTTLVLCGLTASGVCGVSNGDSAAVFWDGGKMLTLTEEQRKNPPVGSGGAALTPFALKATAPWKLLLMSDGVWKYAGWGGVADALQSLSGQPLLQHLRDVVKQRHGGILPDDFTAVLIET